MAMSIEQARELAKENFYYDAVSTAETIIETYRTLYASDWAVDRQKASELLRHWPGLANA